MSPFLALAIFFAEFTGNTETTRVVAKWISLFSVPLLLVSLAGLAKASAETARIQPAEYAGRSWSAVAALLLSIIGLPTAGLGAIAGVVIGAYSLHAICHSRKFTGQRIAMAAIVLGMGKIGFLIMLFFVGP